MSDMDLWLKSMAYHDITHFLKTINEAVKGKKLRQILVPSRNAENILHVFNALHKMTDETPATSGNQASFNWFERMNKESMKLLKKALSSKFDPDLTEINAYFIESFGDPLRNEYRSIHELSFIMFLCVLYKIVALTERDNLYVGLKIFNAYLEVIRKLKSTYRMEPTGSGEDQCIPLIWGSAQLSEEPFESNRSFESNIIERYKNDYIVIHHIQQMNNEQSNQFLSILDDPWEIVNLFLIKKYERKVNNGILHSFFRKKFLYINYDSYFKRIELIELQYNLEILN